MVFVFLYLTSLSIIDSRPTHVAANGSISLKKVFLANVRRNQLGTLFWVILPLVPS